MTITFSELTQLQEAVFRNIQGSAPDFDEFDDLTANPKAKIYAHRLADAGSQQHSAQYHAIDFTFSLTNWPSTRFGNGNYPVWYGATNLETTFHETFYHWYRAFIIAPSGFDKMMDEPAKTIRTVYSVECRAALIDLRNQRIPALNDPDLSSYAITQKIGKQIYESGSPGLLARSARTTMGENVVIFRKETLFAPKHLGNYICEYDAANQNLIVINESTNRRALVTKFRI